MGWGSFFSGITNAVSDAVSDVGGAVSDLGSSIDDTVNQLPGGWTLPLIIAAAYVTGGASLAAEAAAAGETGGAAAAAEAAGGTAALDSAAASAGGMEALSGIDLGGAGASPASWGAGGAAGAGAGVGAGMFSGLGSYATPLAIAGSSILGAGAAKSAAQTQADAQNQSNQLQYKMFQEQQKLQEPWRQTGINALAKLNSGDILGNDPGYAFRLSEGQKALERQAAARGGLISGGALKAATKYGQDMGSQEYTNAFNRYATLAGYGQNATNTLTNAAGTYGTNAGNGITSAGAATAAGNVGQANALASGVGQYLNYTSSQDLTNAIRQSAYTRNNSNGY